MPTGREAGDSIPGEQDTLEGRTSTEVREEAKSVEFTYRGIFQKTLAANLCKHVVMAARKRDWLGSTIQRCSGSPARNGVPAKQFAVIAPDDITLQEHMAKYEPNELDVITVLDDTMCDGIESWAWYGRQPINVRLRRGGTLLVVSNRTAEELLRVIPQKPWDWTLAILPGTPSLGGLWVYRDDGTDMRVLGAIARTRSDIFEYGEIEAVVSESGLGGKYLTALKNGHDEVETHEVKVGEGAEDDYEPVKLPGWREMREAIIVEAVKLGERNPHYRSSSDRTMRPVVNFDTCIKCRQCWIDCPDECFEISAEELHPVNYSYCTGCGICANVCPVEDCIVMVNDLEFVEEGDKDVFPMWEEDKDAYHGVMQAVAKLIASGELDAEFIVAEGEHSQFEICKHASSVGARVFVGSSGVGWMYAMESIAVTPSLRLPVVAMIGNRALDDPGAFGVEHNDALCVRDLGWQLLWVEDAQECFDATLMAYRIGEDSRVSFPVGLGVDGAFITHSQALLQIPDQESVDAFLPPYDLGDRVLHPDNPISIAPQANEDWVMEIRKQADEAAKRVKDVIWEAHNDFKELFGRGGDNPFFEEYMTEDAEYVLFGMGSLGLPAKVMVRRLRDQGEKVGFVRLKWYRPFPDEELAEVLGRFNAVGVVDRAYSYGSPQQGGVLFTDLRAALYAAEKRPRMVNFIGGLGGRELTPEMMDEMADLTKRAGEGEDVPVVSWIGVRE